MELWNPAARRSLTFNGAGAHVFGPYRGVLHTTEGGSLAGALATYRTTHNYPHFTLDADTIEQHCPLNVGSTALEHPSGTIDTNRASAIQIEIVGKAADAYKFPPLLLERLAGLMRWIEAQTGIDFHNHPEFTGLAPKRFTADEWRRFDGWCGHQHVPNNSHWDPGPLQIGKLAPLGFPRPTIKAVYGPAQEYNNVDLVRQEITTEPLGNDGNGYVDTHIPFDKLTGFFAFGPSPDRDGGYDSPNWPDARVTYNNTDGQARLVVENGKPNTPFTVVTWRVA